MADNVPLPEIGDKLPGLPRPLQLVRDLEVFEGTILSELKAGDGGLYLEKWCARDSASDRTLVVRSHQRAVAEYLAGRISMLDLLTKPSDGIGFLVDRKGAEIDAVYLVALAILPQKYLPAPTAFHDESLRPEWAIEPQYFLIHANWDARLLATVERRYLDVAGFSYFTAQDADRALSPDVLKYHHDGGYAIMHTFRHVRDAVPRESRAKAVGVSANSPGVLTMDAPHATVVRIMGALGALSTSQAAYDALYSWSRFHPSRAPSLPLTAMDDLKSLAGRLGVRVGAILPDSSDGEDKALALLVAGKLLAAYYRKLWLLLSPTEDFEFISAAQVLRGPISPAFDDDDGIPF